MGAVFKKPKVPAPPPPPTPPPPPVVEDTAARAQADADALRRRKGRAATLLTGRSNTGGDTGGVTTGTKQLLGQ